MVQIRSGVGSRQIGSHLGAPSRLKRSTVQSPCRRQLIRLLRLPTLRRRRHRPGARAERFLNDPRRVLDVPADRLRRVLDDGPRPEPGPELLEPVVQVGRPFDIEPHPRLLRLLFSARHHAPHTVSPDTPRHGTLTCDPAPGNPLKWTGPAPLGTGPHRSTQVCTSKNDATRTRNQRIDSPPVSIAKPKHNKAFSAADEDGRSAGRSEPHQEGTADPDLAALVAAWPTLPHHIKAAIRALVGSVHPSG